MQRVPQPAAPAHGSVGGLTGWAGNECTGTGENIFFGVTAGYARSTAYDNNVAFSGSFEAPFLGAYSVLTYGNFFADVMLRGNFYQMQLENPLVSIRDQSLNAHGWCR